MTPTTEQLKDLLAKVTPGEWVAEWPELEGPRYIASSLTTSCTETAIAMLGWRQDADATLIALAPTLAAEVVRLREALEEIALQDQFNCRRNGEIVPDWGLCGQIARQALDATSEK